MFSPFAEDSCLFTDLVLLRRFLLVDVRTLSENPRTSFRLPPPVRENFRLPRLKFDHKFACTCEASEFAFRDEAGGGCAFHCAAACPLSCFLPFSFFHLRPSILGLFGVLLQTPAPQKNVNPSIPKDKALSDIANDFPQQRPEGLRF